MRSVFQVAAALLVFSQIAAASAAEPDIESIVRRCRDQASPSALGQTASYGLVGVEAAAGVLGIYLIKFGVTKGNVAGSQNDLVSLTGTSVLAGAAALEVFRRNTIPLSSSFNEDQLRSMLVEFSTDVRGAYSESILQACEQANSQRKVHFDCADTLNRLKQEALSGSALRCDADQAAQEIQRELRR